MSRRACFLFVLLSAGLAAGCGEGSTDIPTPREGPILPIPGGLWSPPGGTPAGNFVYLASDAGDYIGQGSTNTYTTNITVSATGALLGVTVAGYGGSFQGMDAITTLQRGYYPNLERYGFHQPAIGGLSWEGNGRGCNMLTGWFVIDAVTYQGGQLAAIDLRFEQHCEGGAPALHGALHWVTPP